MASAALHIGGRLRKQECRRRVHDDNIPARTRLSIEHGANDPRVGLRIAAFQIVDRSLRHTEITRATIDPFVRVRPLLEKLW